MAMLNNKRVKYHVALLQCQKTIGGWLESHPFMLFNTEDGLIIGFTTTHPANQACAGCDGKGVATSGGFA